MRIKYPLSGQVYIGIVISIALLLILSQTIFTLVVSVFDLVSFTKARTAATQLASEKIEIIKNLNYSDVGTVGGIPNGIIEPEEIALRGGLPYTISTRIVNIDDPFDESAPVDTEAADYKHVEVSVTWGGTTGRRASPIVYTTNIAPPGSYVGTGGVLAISVVDSNSNPLADASVAIVASGVTPPVNTQLQTDVNGEVTLPGALPCLGCYRVTVTKAGMSTDRTYSTTEVTNPSKPHATVNEGLITSLSFSIDTLSQIDITSTYDRENDFAIFPDQSFVLRGEKTIGTDSFSAPVFKYNEVNITNGSGTLSLPNMEWDNYHIIIPSGGVWDITGTNPILPVSLLPGQTADVTFSATPSSTHRLLTIFTDSSSNPIASVSATIDNGGPSESVLSGNSGDPDYGQAFFQSLSEDTYTITATASGYLNFTSEVIVTGYTTERIIMEEEP